jgi:hypothetical protein
MQQPVIQLNYLAIVAAVIAQFVLGFLWYGPIFGKEWMAEMKIPAGFKPEPKVMYRGMLLMVVGSFLTAFVLTHNMQAWRPAAWNAGMDASNAVYGFFGGFFTWLGFYVPLLLGDVAWENKSWKLFWINAAHYFLALQITGMILSYWR